MKNKSLKNRLIIVFTVLVIAVSSLYMALPAEGMYPLSEISNIDLVGAGLKIDPMEVYNPEGVSLIDALVNVGGCTGSFVSAEGLIVTNHHCAFGAINNASTTENNYLENGFWAESREKEIPARGTNVKITESYEDVSEKVLAVVENVTDPVKRIEMIDAIIEELEASESDVENSIEAKVSEMFTGKTYILFRYRVINDVRLVYAPPRKIGEFGGESDNWVWPRHTGDFTFMRAYVAPDGSAAKYSDDNVPFTPNKHLQVNPKGVNEDDFVFILGYPARTYRHKSSFFLEYQNEIQLPYIQELFADLIDILEQLSEESVENQLKYATSIKRLANTEKNYRGKMKGIRRLSLVDKKKAEEEELKSFINSSDDRKEEYGNIFNQLEDVYNKKMEIGYAYWWTRIGFRYSGILNNIDKMIEYAEQMALPEDQRESKFTGEKATGVADRLKLWAASFDADKEYMFFDKFISDAATFEGNSEVTAVTSRLGNENDTAVLVEALLKDFEPGENNIITKLMEKEPKEILKSNNELVELVRELRELKENISEQDETIKAELTKIYASFTEAKKEWKKTEFIPDANRTLRLTYGYIKGYSPADAVYYSPVTTLDGVIEKSYMGGDYKIPEKLRELYEAEDYGMFKDPNTGSVPVALLYNTDTSGGNSGSPILDAYGNLVGVNFDRAFDATINDFAWDDDYSRSIGVDIRYVLWITQKYGGADILLSEMGINNK